jgi:hypothetical protein
MFRSSGLIATLADGNACMFAYALFPTEAARGAGRLSTATGEHKFRPFISDARTITSP